MFTYCKIAMYLRWNAEDANLDGTLQHPRDGEAWKNFGTTSPEFYFDPQNVRLVLPSDGLILF